MQTILVGVDFSDVTTRAVSAALRVAEAFKGRVILVHVAAAEPEFVTYEVGPQHQRDWRAEKLRDQHRQLQELESNCRAKGFEVRALMVPGQAVEKLIAEAQRFGAELIVLGSHGHGALFELLVGSVTEGVLRKAPCPVLVVPSR